MPVRATHLQGVLTACLLAAAAPAWAAADLRPAAAAAVRGGCAAIAADAGIVRSHAIAMLPATAHRTFDVPFVVPTPMIAPVIVCVVDTGIPKCVAMNNVIDPAASAANPPTGFNFVMR